MNARVFKVHADDVTPNRRRGGDLRVTLSPKTARSTSGFGGVMWLAPGEVVTEHYHPYSEEFVHLITGDLTMTVDGERLHVQAGESVLIPIAMRHRVVNTGARTAHLVFHLSPLAPRPELGHVDIEPPVASAAPQPGVGGLG
ncbi:cupin [Actinosynnema sp. ALI-1.44]|uniref:cupin domain-containing protein n=1 Tax=Actinosynnema sp. ALI-1.44 TaxID=1933779 RepID=UPI00097CB95F|nr:cupin domain-containing protein [Actinosynnema sp. ALI-1.44]ONI77907.1 cupin [Actinosynnema sp. ALI-1.44]